MISHDANVRFFSQNSIIYFLVNSWMQCRHLIRYSGNNGCSADILPDAPESNGCNAEIHLRCFGNNGCSADTLPDASETMDAMQKSIYNASEIIDAVQTSLLDASGIMDAVQTPRPKRNSRNSLSFQAKISRGRRCRSGRNRAGGCRHPHLP